MRELTAALMVILTVVFRRVDRLLVLLAPSVPQVVDQEPPIEKKIEETGGLGILRKGDLKAGVVVIEEILSNTQGKYCSSLLEPLGRKEDSVRELLNRLLLTLPFLERVRTAGGYLYRLKRNQEAEARGWVANHKTPQFDRKVSSEVESAILPSSRAVLRTDSVRGFILNCPNGKSFRATRARDLKHKGKKLGLIVDDETTTAERTTP